MKALWGRLGNFPAGLRSSTRSRSLLPLSWQPGVLGGGAPARRAAGKAEAGARPPPPPAPPLPRYQRL